ncbi:MAG: hypothetical protein JWL59_3411 [Chthoniobacteraceae bacterium]|nr:hypothetical protein [Chthoniobacteraceae bacterium]
MNRQFAIFLQILDTSATSRLTLEAMKLFRHIITLVCVVASLVANAGEPLTAKAKGPANQPTAVELEPLQGTWEGALVGDDARQTAFRIEGYLALLVGQKVPHRRTYSPSEGERRIWQQHRKNFAAAAARAFDVRQTLETIRRRSWKWS